jgi:phosphatidylinositol 4-phosphatase
MQIGGVPKGLPFEPFADRDIERAFRNVWTDNADVLAILYSGTPALKTDFTRTMKRTYWGALQDGKHSMHRYYINNFCDGYNQDCLDMTQKKLTPISNLHKRSMLTSLKMALLGLTGLLFLTHYFLKMYLPYPE